MMRSSSSRKCRLWWYLFIGVCVSYIWKISKFLQVQEELAGIAGIKQEGLISDLHHDNDHHHCQQHLLTNTTEKKEDEKKKKNPFLTSIDYFAANDNNIIVDNVTGIGSIPSDDYRYNGVQLGDISFNAIRRRYPKVDIETCLSMVTTDTELWFEIQYSINNNNNIPTTKQNNSNKLLSLSLFRKIGHPPFGSPNDDNDTKRFETKYLQPLIVLLEEAETYLSDYDIHLYLANDLEYLILDKGTKKENKEKEKEEGRGLLNKLVMKQDSHLTVHVMKTSSIGSSPGMLWRFLNLNNKNYELVAVADTDQPLPAWLKNGIYENELRNNMDVGLVTIPPRDNFVNRKKLPRCLAMNFATIIGSTIMVRPSSFQKNFDMKSIMIGFIRLVQQRNSKTKFLTFHDNEPLTFWNYPCYGCDDPLRCKDGTHVNGWGTNPYGYGFDERFLKHVIFYATNVKFVPKNKKNNNKTTSII